MNIVTLPKRQTRIDLENDYEKEISKILALLPADANDKEKLKIFYEWFIQNVEIIPPDKLKCFGGKNGFYPKDFVYKNGERISTNQKECPILIRQGLCECNSLAFKDLCERAGILCEISENNINNGKIDKSISPVGHKWNTVKIAEGSSNFKVYKKYTVDTVLKQFLTPQKIKRFDKITIQEKQHGGQRSNAR
jgi:transglutaminase/protease-like cytokinesis protein 3